MTLATPLRRSLAALPLLALAITAAVVEPPSLGEPLEAALVAGWACEPGPRPAGALGLARMPGDLAVIGRRLYCAG